MDNPNKDPRIECEWGLVVFPKQKFWLDLKVFKHIACQEILNAWCYNCTKVDNLKDCSKRTLFLTIIPDE